MAKFWAVFKREYLERVRTKWFIIGTFVFPLLFAGLMFGQAVLSNKAMRGARVSNIKILDIGTGRFADEVRGRLVGPAGEPDSIPIVRVAPGEQAAAESLAVEAVKARTLQGYLVLDTAAVSGSRARYAARDASSVGITELIERSIEGAVLRQRLEREGLDSKRLEGLMRVNLALKTDRVTDRGVGGAGRASMVLAIVVVIVLYMTLILFGSSILMSVVEEKTTRVSEVIAASVKAEILLAGKVLGVASVALTQQAVWIASAVTLYFTRGPILARFGVSSATPIPIPDVGLGFGLLFFAIFIFGFTFYACLFAAAGATVNSTQDAQAAAGPVTMMIVVAFMFAQPVFLAPDSALAVALSWIPFTSPVILPVRLALTELSLFEKVGSVLMLMISTGVAVWFSAKIYRVGMLMYGKRPSFRELGRWIAQA